MATTTTPEERIEATLKRLLLEEYPTVDQTIVAGLIKETADVVVQNFATAPQAPRNGIRPLKFFNLPRELRDKVYDLLVTTPDGLPIAVNECHGSKACYRHKKYGTRDCSSDFKRAPQPAITRASRQLRREALPLFYSLNEFDICVARVSRCEDNAYGLCEATGVSDAGKWLFPLRPRDVRCIRKIIVRYTHRADWGTLTDQMWMPLEGVKYIKELSDEEDKELIGEHGSYHTKEDLENDDLGWDSNEDDYDDEYGHSYVFDYSEEEHWDNESEEGEEGED